MMNKNELELYIHIPFCAHKCNYCDFLSYAAPERSYRGYVDKLIEEIYGQGANFQNSHVSTVFLGGGTPSMLPAHMVEELFAVLYGCFDIDMDAEVTIEANPGTLTMDKLETYLQSGINRISLGLQSSDDKELKMLGRIHTFDGFLKSYQRARQAGFTNINIDLLSALPGQNLHSWKNTLRKVAMLKPEHISAYSLTIEEGTPFYERYGPKNVKQYDRLWAKKKAGGSRGQGGGALRGPDMEKGGVPGNGAPKWEDWPPLPDEEEDRKIYHLTKEFLASQGYARYEISNYARPGRECLHNIGYWTGVDYLGLGLGASSYVGGRRFCNTPVLREYLSLDLRRPGGAAQDIQELTMEEKMEEFMFLGLRMVQGVSGSEFLGRFGRNMWNIYEPVLARLKAQGLIEVEAPWVRLTERGTDVSNQVLSEFLLG